MVHGNGAGIRVNGRVDGERATVNKIQQRIKKKLLEENENYGEKKVLLSEETA